MLDESGKNGKKGWMGFSALPQLVSQFDLSAFFKVTKAILHDAGDVKSTSPFSQFDLLFGAKNGLLIPLAANGVNRKIRRKMNPLRDVKLPAIMWFCRNASTL
jgi:hypothetical protein